MSDIVYRMSDIVYPTSDMILDVGYSISEGVIMEQPTQNNFDSFGTQYTINGCIQMNRVSTAKSKTYIIPYITLSKHLLFF